MGKEGESRVLYIGMINWKTVNNKKKGIREPPLPLIVLFDVFGRVYLSQLLGRAGGFQKLYGISVS